MTAALKAGVRSDDLKSNRTMLMAVVIGLGWVACTTGTIGTEDFPFDDVRSVNLQEDAGGLTNAQADEANDFWKLTAGPDAVAYVLEETPVSRGSIEFRFNASIWSSNLENEVRCDGVLLFDPAPWIMEPITNQTWETQLYVMTAEVPEGATSLPYGVICWRTADATIWA